MSKADFLIKNLALLVVNTSSVKSSIYFLLKLILFYMGNNEQLFLKLFMKILKWRHFFLIHKILRSW